MRRFIAIAEKELELYYRHVALYGDPNDRNPLSMLDSRSKNFGQKGNHGIHDGRKLDLSSDHFSANLSETEADSSEMELSGTEDNSENEDLSMNESDSEEESISYSDDEQGREVYFTKRQGESICSTTGSSSMSEHSHRYNNHHLSSR